MRYIVNECFGTVLLNSDMLGYVNSGNARNIGSKRAIYVKTEHMMNGLRVEVMNG